MDPTSRRTTSSATSRPESRVRADHPLAGREHDGCGLRRAVAALRRDVLDDRPPVDSAGAVAAGAGAADALQRFAASGC